MKAAHYNLPYSLILLENKWKELENRPWKYSYDKIKQEVQERLYGIYLPSKLSVYMVRLARTVNKYAT